MDFRAKKDQVDYFYNVAMSDDARRELLAHYRVKYVWLGSRERGLGKFDPGTRGYLMPVFASEDVTVYQVGDLR